MRALPGIIHLESWAVLATFSECQCQTSVREPLRARLAPPENLRCGADWSISMA